MKISSKKYPRNQFRLPAAPPLESTMASLAVKLKVWTHFWQTCALKITCPKWPYLEKSIRCCFYSNTDAFQLEGCSTLSKNHLSRRLVYTFRNKTCLSCQILAVALFNFQLTWGNFPLTKTKFILRKDAIFNLLFFCHTKECVIEHDLQCFLNSNIKLD